MSAQLYQAIALKVFSHLFNTKTEFHIKDAFSAFGNELALPHFLQRTVPDSVILCFLCVSPPHLLLTQDLPGLSLPGGPVTISAPKNKSYFLCLCENTLPWFSSIPT